MIRKYALVPFMLAATAVIGMAAVGEAKRADARRRLEEIRIARDTVVRTEKRMLRMPDGREMVFEVLHDGADLCKVRFVSMSGGAPNWGPRKEGWRDWSREGRDGKDGKDWKDGKDREPGPRPPHHGPPPARSSAPGDLELIPALASENYNVVEAGKAVIASRPVDGLELVPRASDRGSLRIWADEQTRVPLRLESRPAGSAEWSLIYDVQSVSFEPVEKLTGGAAPEKADPMVVPQWMPSGFTHVSTVKQTWRGWGGRPPREGEKKEGEPKEVRAPRESFESKYSDGVATIRIMVSTHEPWWRKHDKPAPQGAVPVARHKMGAFAEYGLQVDGLYVTVMGALSEETMQKVVGSLKRK